MLKRFKKLLEDIFFSFSYYIIIDNTEEDSPFCGFSLNLCNAIPEIKKVITLPKNIIELGKDKRNKFKRRLYYQTSHYIFPIKYNSFCTTSFELPCLLPVIIYDKIRFPDIPDIIKKFNNKPFLIELEQIISDKDFIDFFYERIKSFQEKNCTEVPVEFIKNLEKEIEKEIEVEKIFYKAKLHGTTSFFVYVLENNGFDFINKSDFSNLLIEDEYVKNIFDFNRFIKKFIDSKKIKPKNKIDCIFTSAPLYTKYLLKKEFNNFNDKEMSKAFNKLISQVGYYHKGEFDIEKMKTSILLRQGEMQLYYLCLSLIFEKYFTPIIRLPQGVQTDVQGELDAFVNSKNDKKTNAYNALIKKEEKYFFDYISMVNTYKKIPRVKIYSDGPAELVRDKKNHLPLLISTSLCKIPTTPGNIFFNSVSNDLDIFIQIDELYKILIIRSFNDTDNYKNVLEKCINDFFVGTGIVHIKYIFEDAKDCNSVIELLNRYKDVKIVIFDCHGQQGKNDIFGSLIIGNEKFNIWEYVQSSNFFHLPPIILFSACNTFPFGNNFNSIANGFLAAGAKSVIGTNSPVDSIESGIFIARILYRIDLLLSTFVSDGKVTTWLDFISDFFRMSYVTDISKYFLEHELISVSDHIEIGENENWLINLRNPEWFQSLIKFLSEKSNKSRNEIEEIIFNEIGFTETMKYIVLGNADSIYIHE